ncbi:MAG TPA: APC family permease [Acidimicrobiia bacterium]|nr:APC family permease [Acidimicrobiia bacterium]
MAILKRLLVGRPIPTVEQEQQRIPKTIALAVFSSDAISSTAYATEEILFVTAVGGSSLMLGLDSLIPIAIGVAILLAIVTASYRQTIYAYPSGGGSYIVSRENLGEGPSLVAGASLLVDYMLTVAVSISAGVAAIVSIPAFHGLATHRVELALGLIAFIAIANLRGIKESGRLFAAPTYIYIFTLGALVVYGLFRTYFGDIHPVPFDPKAFEGSRVEGGTLGLFLILKGFSSGAVALTGVEAISNGVPAFRRPESKNAATTLTWMATILGSLFFGVSLLAHRLHPYPSHDETVISQLGRAVFGDGPVYVLLQFATAAILTLAANTAYADFPRLSSIIARDGYLPRQLANRGDRLVFSNGILVLSGLAGLLIVAFGGITNALIPLYAVGVFASFTLSQSGMVIHHLRLREPGWKRNLVINVVGAIATFVVLLIIAITKFTSGAWVPIIVIPAIVLLFKGIHGHYQRVGAKLSIPPDYRPPPMNHTMVVLVGGLHRGVLDALAYAKSLNPTHIAAVSVVSDEEQQERIEKIWAERNIDVPLEIVYDPYREVTTPILRYIDEIDARWDNDIITVLIPEFVVEHWWGHLLHNQTALLLKGRLLFRKGTVVTSIPYHLQEASEDGSAK